MRTVPVKYSVGPLPEGREPLRLISIGFLLALQRTYLSPPSVTSLASSTAVLHPLSGLPPVIAAAADCAIVQIRCRSYGTGPDPWAARAVGLLDEPPLERSSARGSLQLLARGPGV